MIISFSKKSNFSLINSLVVPLPIIIFEEKNTTYRAKARYFELFPISRLKFFIPREVFLLNKNLDAISALIILEDYCKMKFTLHQSIDFKTWLK